MDKTSLRFIYKSYIDKVDPKYHCSEEEYKAICYLFNKKMSELMIHKGFKFKLPGRLGTLSVAKNKMKYHNIHFNFELYNKEGIKSYFINDHSDNYYAFVRWNKVACIVHNKVYYGFRFTRDNNREIAKVMKTENGHQLYEIATRKDAI